MGSYPSDFPAPADQGGPGAGQPVGGFGGNPATRAGRAPAGGAAHREGPRAAGPWQRRRRGHRPVGHARSATDAAGRRVHRRADLGAQLSGAGHARPADPAHRQRRRPPRLPRHRVHLPRRRRGRRDRPLAGLLPDLRGLSRPGAAHRTDRLGPTEEMAATGHLRRPGRRLPRPGQRRARRVADRGRVHERAAHRNPRRRRREPFGAGKPQTAAPTPHNITYFCGVARGDFIDAQNPGTGLLAGAVNKNYNLGTGLDGHEKIKESPLVFADFLPLLNRVPPAPGGEADRGPGQRRLPHPADRHPGRGAGDPRSSPSPPPGSPKSSSTASSSTRSWRTGRKPSPSARPSPWPPTACGS